MIRNATTSMKIVCNLLICNNVRLLTNVLNSIEKFANNTGEPNNVTRENNANSYIKTVKERYVTACSIILKRKYKEYIISNIVRMKGKKMRSCIYMNKFVSNVTHTVCLPIWLADMTLCVECVLIKIGPGICMLINVLFVSKAYRMYI